MAPGALASNAGVLNWNTGVVGCRVSNRSTQPLERPAKNCQRFCALHVTLQTGIAHVYTCLLALLCSDVRRTVLSTEHESSSGSPDTFGATDELACSLLNLRSRIWPSCCSDTYCVARVSFK